MAFAALMLGGLIVLGAFLILVLAAIAAIGYFVRISNSLVRMKNHIDQSLSIIDVLFKQRHDELPKLIETCKGYMQREQKALQAVTEARSSWARAATPQEKAHADNHLTGALKTLFAVVENYPDLKANTNFKQLQTRITGLEEKIAVQCTSYNQAVNDYNMRIAQLPANFVAGFMHLQPHPLLQAAESDREDMKVSFT
jgi:LemA protein